jgi:NDP-sugar pyrophosphorylase family protein
VLEPGIFGLSERTGTFSIITLYLELARAGWIIQPVDVTGQTWFDIGTAEKLDLARSWIKERTRSP